MQRSLIATAFAVAILSLGSGSASSTARAAEVGDAKANRGVLEHAWFNHHAVRLELDGTLAGVVKRHSDSGVLVGAGKVRVYLYSNGQLVRLTRTDDDGNFQIVATPGVYSIMAGDLGDTNGFAGTMIQVLPADRPPPMVDGQAISAPGEPLPPPKPPVDAQRRVPPKRLELCLIHPGDVAKFRNLLVVAARRRQLARSASAPAAGQVRSEPQRDLFALLGGQAAEPAPPRAAVSLAKVDLSADDLNRLRSIPFDGPWYLGHQLFVHPDGNLRGRMRTLNSDGSLNPASGIDVHLLRRAQPTSVTQSRATTSAQGTYLLQNVEPGVYSVVAVSPSGGFGAFGIRLVPGGAAPGAAPEPMRSIKVRNVAFQAEGQDQDTDVDSSIVSDADGNGFLANGAVNGLDTPTGPTGNIAGGPGGGAGGGGDPFAAALLGAALGAAAGYGIAEALASP